MRTLIEAVQSDHLTVLFDIGNTISHGYEPWEFYTGIRELIGYVHVKDCIRSPQGGRSETYCLPGDGDARVKDILRDLFQNGYSGVASIEPHIAKIIHNDQAADPQKLFQSYINYARRFEQIVADVQEK